MASLANSSGPCRSSFSRSGVSTSLYHPLYLVVAFALPADELAVGNRINCRGVLEEPVEQETTRSRTPSVETERVFIQVIVEMLPAHSPLVGSKQPALQQRSHPVDTWHQLVRWFVMLAQNGDLMRVALCLDAVVGRPPVRVDDRSGGDALLDKRVQTVRRHIGNSPQSNPPNSSAVFLRRDGHNRLVFSFSAVNALFRTAQVGLIHLDAAFEALPARPHHRTAQLMEPSPSCLVAAQAQDPLQAQCTSSRLLTRDMPHRLEPHAQWLSGALVDGSRSRRRLTVAPQALELTSGRGTGSLPMALWASEALRPPNTPQVRSARFFRGEPFVELLQSSGVVHAADGVSLIIANHALILHVVAGRAKWIPRSGNLGKSTSLGLIVQQ